MWVVVEPACASREIGRVSIFGKSELCLLRIGLFLDPLNPQTLYHSDEEAVLSAPAYRFEKYVPIHLLKAVSHFVSLSGCIFDIDLRFSSA